MIEIKEENREKAEFAQLEIRSIIEQVHERTLKKDRKQFEEHLKSIDPNVWMIDQDKWMIGKPADKECYEFLDKASENRRDYSFGTLILFSASLPFPLNIAYILGVIFARFIKRSI
jgi:hypothetical protein